MSKAERRTSSTLFGLASKASTAASSSLISTADSAALSALHRQGAKVGERGRGRPAPLVRRRSPILATMWVTARTSTTLISASRWYVPTRASRYNCSAPARAASSAVLTGESGPASR